MESINKAFCQVDVWILSVNRGAKSEGSYQSVPGTCKYLG